VSDQSGHEGISWAKPNQPNQPTQPTQPQDYYGQPASGAPEANPAPTSPPAAPYGDPQYPGPQYPGPQYPGQQYPAAQYGAQPPHYGAPNPYAPQPQWGQQPNQWGPYGYPPSRTTNGMAIASLVLGIVWIYWIGSVLALIFGYIAKSQIKQRHENGGGLATAGIVLGWIGVTIFVTLVIVGVANSS
jgi:hypothetical protein